jgi:signal transduction histidine kinase
MTSKNRKFFLGTVLIPFLFMFVLIGIMTYIHDNGIKSERAFYNKAIEELLIDNNKSKIKDILSKVQENENETFKSLLLSSIFLLLLFLIFSYLVVTYYKRIIKSYILDIEEKNNELNKYKNNLEKVIDAQVSELRKKDKMLILNSRQLAIGDTMGNIAHQWRQPLNVLSLKKDIFIDKLYDEDVNEHDIDSFDSEISNILKDLSKTIDDFRDLFISSNDKSSFSIKKQIQDVLNMLSAELIDNNISIDTNLKVDLEVYSYKNEFKQVLINIIQNSKESILKAKKQSLITSGQISVSLKKDNDFVYIDICDNGVGIKSDIINNIFEPYFTTKFKSQGTGLGLYMCKMIVEENLYGFISVENKKENGVCFTIKLDIEKNIPNE